MDLVSINNTLQDVLAGKVCVRAWTGYGDPLFASFRPDGRVPLQAQSDGKAGLIELQTNFSDWTVSIPGSVVGGGPDGRNPEDAAEGLVGKTVLAVSIADDRVLLMEFEDGTKLKIAPWPAEQTLTDAWCIDLDNGNVLAVPTIGRPRFVDPTSPIHDWFTSEP